MPRTPWEQSVIQLALAALLLGGWSPTILLAASQNVVVVLDDSGSMEERMRREPRTTRIEAAKRALIAVLETLPDTANVGIVLLNGRIDGDPWLTRLGPVNMEQIRGAMRGVQARGGTPLGRFMKEGADELLKSRGSDIYGDYRLLIVTDGEATDPRRVRSFLPDILARGITTDVIGVDMDDDHSLATEVHSYRRADDPDSLLTAVSEVFAETSADAADAGESDFELLEGVPTEWARAAIAALSERNDAPIGESPRPNDFSGGSGQPDTDGAGNTDGAGKPMRGIGWMGVFLLVIVWVTISKLIKTITRRRR